MAKLMLLTAVAASLLASPAAQLSAQAICAGPYDVFWVPTAHLDLVIRGENIVSEPDGVWTTLTDVSSGETAYLTYEGPSSGYSGVVIHNVAYSIRGTVVIPLVSGAEYLVQVWRGEYSVFVPELTELIAETTVTMPATCYQVYLPMIFR